MKKKIILILVLSIFLLFTLTLMVQGDQDEVSLIPMKDFFKNPEKNRFFLISQWRILGISSTLGKPLEYSCAENRRRKNYQNY